MLLHELHYSVPGRWHSAGVHYYFAGTVQPLHMPEHDALLILPAFIWLMTDTATRGSANPAEPLFAYIFFRPASEGKNPYPIL